MTRCSTVGGVQVIRINEQSNTPIYQQVYDELLNLIVLKVLPEHEKLPSVREMALNLKINPNTIQKTYKALEHDGFIYSKPGKGNFVKSEEEVRLLYKDTLVETLKTVIDTWKSYGMSHEDITKAVSLILKESNDAEN